MTGVFISHASHDKPFVRNLAASLLAEGIPVWLDSWELDVGDPLTSRIETGIRDSSLFVVVISKRSVESGWVERELRAALAQESQTGRKFIFPIKIEDCSTPEFMEERVYVDFTQGFSHSFGILVSALERHGALALVPDADKELICISFTKETNLDQARLWRNVESFRKRHPTTEITPRQIKVVDDQEYLNLKQMLHTRIDHVHADKYWSPEFERGLKSIPADVREEERVLSRGAAIIINAESGAADLRESLYWFLKFVRSRLCYSLHRAQNPDLDVSPYGKDSTAWESTSSTGMARFYGVEDTLYVDAWSAKHSRSSYQVVYIGLEQLREQKHRDSRSIPYASGLEEYCWNSAFYRYVLPQALFWSLRRGVHKEIWKQEDIIIGPH